MHETLDPTRPIDVSRGRRLPHWFQPESTHSVTMRLKDSLPKAEGERWHANRCHWLRAHGLAHENPRWRDGFMELPANQRQEYHHRFSEGFQRLLDRGFGGCALADPEAAAVLVETLHHFDGDRYHLGDYVVMPNHLHVLLTPLGDHALQAILTGWKRWSARQINLINGGPVASGRARASTTWCGTRRSWSASVATSRRTRGGCERGPSSTGGSRTEPMPGRWLTHPVSVDAQAGR